MCPWPQRHTLLSLDLPACQIVLLAKSGSIRTCSHQAAPFSENDAASYSYYVRIHLNWHAVVADAS